MLINVGRRIVGVFIDDEFDKDKVVDAMEEEIGAVVES